MSAFYESWHLGLKKNSCWVPAPLFTLPMILTESQLPHLWNNVSLPCPCGDQMTHVKALLQSENQQKMWAAFVKLFYFLRCLSDDSQWPVGEESTHWKRSWCLERLRAGGEGGDKWWDGWTSSLTQWAWVWANSRRWWGQGSLACCSPWVRKSRTRLSDWTTMASKGVLCWTPLIPSLHT